MPAVDFDRVNNVGLVLRRISIAAANRFDIDELRFNNPPNKLFLLAIVSPFFCLTIKVYHRFYRMQKLNIIYFQFGLCRFIA